MTGRDEKLLPCRSLIQPIVQVVLIDFMCWSPRISIKKAQLVVPTFGTDGVRVRPLHAFVLDLIGKTEHGGDARKRCWRCTGKAPVNFADCVTGCLTGFIGFKGFSRVEAMLIAFGIRVL
jgi:hypothetical protein